MRVTIDSFRSIRFLSKPLVSEDGAYIAVQVIQATEKSYAKKVAVFDRARQDWFFSAADARLIAWHDGHVIYEAVREEEDRARVDAGNEQCVWYRWDPRGGEAQRWITIPKCVQDSWFMPDGSILFVAPHLKGTPELYTLNEQEKAAELTRRKDAKEYEEIEQIPFWYNGSGFTYAYELLLYRYYDGETTCISESWLGSANIEELSIQGNKAVICYRPHEACMKDRNCVLVLDLTTNKVLHRYEERTHEISAAFLDSKDELWAVASDLHSYGINENMNIYRMPLGTWDFERPLLSPDRSVMNAVGSDMRNGSGKYIQFADDKLYTLGVSGYESKLFEVDAEGIERVVAEGRGSVDSFTIFEGKPVVVAMWDYKLQEVYMDGAKLGSLNGNYHETYESIEPQYFSAQAVGGPKLDAWFIAPTNMEKAVDGKVPVILDIHGGPKTAYGEVYYHEMQYWAAQGYAVVFGNPRGSDGRGNAFADVRGLYGSIDYDDLMAIFDKALELNTERFDADRSFVTGGSYGGFMTNWIIGHNHRFKAAATQRSISNWFSKFGTTDIGYYFVTDQQACDPWSDPEKLWALSPMKYYDKVKTPTLVIHSMEDYRCWLPGGMQLFTSLQYLGVKSKLVLFYGETHELSRSGKPHHRIKRLDEITRWFDAYA